MLSEQPLSNAFTVANNRRSGFAQGADAIPTRRFDYNSAADRARLHSAPAASRSIY
jgi:hypothetical protein